LGNRPCIANADGDRNGYSDSDVYPYCDCHGYRDSHVYSYSDRNGHSHRHIYPNSNTGVADADSNTDANPSCALYRVGNGRYCRYSLHP
jgi:hypothetical protein